MSSKARRNRANLRRFELDASEQLHHMHACIVPSKGSATGTTVPAQSHTRCAQFPGHPVLSVHR